MSGGAVRHGLIGTALLSVAAPVGLSGQDIPTVRPARAESVLVVAGLRYGAGWLHGAMAGRGYRDLWVTPMMVEVADLSRLGDGLTPIRVGGGATTMTLHMRGADGKRYVLRSVDKYTAQGLEEEFRDTPVAAILQDQISAFHPSGALVVAPLLSAAGVLHVEPRLLVLPDDPRLDEFREDFAGLLVLFEERPNNGPQGTPGFAGSKRILDSRGMMADFSDSPRNRMDTRALLTARLVDLLVGDRDRNLNNWWWARFDDGDAYVWRPIPRDRDQVFIKLDGFLKSIVRFYEPRLVAFGEKYSSIVGLSRNAWDIDRRFLVGLDKPAWDSVVTELQQKLTDSVIESAVRRMPPEHYGLIGAELTHQLKVRRDSMRAAADQLYDIVSQYADVRATDVADVAEITAIGEDHVEVRLYDREEGGGEQPPAPYFRRIFDRRETREVRVYLLDGADRAVVRGRIPRDMRVRVIGGSDPDELVDATEAGGGRVYFYDAGGRTQVSRGPRTDVVRRRVNPPVHWDDEGGRPDWGHQWIPLPSFALNGDVGLFVAAGAAYTRYGFLKKQFSSRVRFSVGYASGPGRLGRFDFRYRHDFKELARNIDASLDASFTGMEIIHFHGFGNETAAPRSSSYYQLKLKQLRLAPVVSFGSGSKLGFEAGPVLKSSASDTTVNPGSIVSDPTNPASRPYGSGRFDQVGGRASFGIDTRDQPVAATKGFLFTGGASYYPSLLDIDEPFGEIHGAASAYLSPSANQTLALRVGAKKVWGRAPFFEAAFVGGRTVRGFRQQRFAGNASLYANAELRLFVTRFFVLLPGEFGVFGLTDVGRVFNPGEVSTAGCTLSLSRACTWHASVGGGFWIAPIARSATVSVAFAKSAEGTGLYIGSGFLY